MSTPQYCIHNLTRTQDILLGLNCVGGKDTALMASLLGYVRLSLPSRPLSANLIQQPQFPPSIIWCNVEATTLTVNIPFHIQKSHVAWILADPME